MEKGWSVLATGATQAECDVAEELPDIFNDASGIDAPPTEEGQEEVGGHQHYQWQRQVGDEAQNPEETE